MSEQEEQCRVRRILVALDASPHSLSALEAAAELAANLEAELEGLFVEDTNLLTLTQLPFARELSFFSGDPRRLEAKEMERQIRAQATQVRQAMAQIAERSRIQWNFRVSRGSVSEEILSAAAQADLCLLGKVGWSLTGTRYVGSTVQAVLSQRRGPTMVLQKGGKLAVPVLVLYHGSALSQNALRMAMQLFPGKHQPITLFMLAEDEASFDRWKNEVSEMLQAQGWTAECRLIVASNLRNLAQAVKREGGGPLVVPCEGPFKGSEAIRDLIHQIPNPVLMVHSPDESEIEGSQ